VLDALEVFAEKLCACTNRSCADRVSSEMTEWSKTETEPTVFADEDEKRVSAVTARMAECSKRATQLP